MQDKRKIYILLTYTGTVFSKLIKIRTRTRYTHVSISLDRNFNELYSFGRLNPKNPFRGGFVKEHPQEGLYKEKYNTKCVLYSLTVSEKQYQLIKYRINEFKQKNCKYNLIGVFTLLFNVPLKREDRFFCSQFVAHILLSSGIELFDKAPEKIFPKDFLANNQLDYIYSGYLNSIASNA